MRSSIWRTCHCVDIEANNRSSKIDAHHHFWSYTPEEYGWIDESMSIIRRDFLPEDLEAEISACGIDGLISVQARQTLEETRWLVRLAAKHSFVRGVVGWVPLADSRVEDLLGEYKEQGWLKAIRHVLQGEPDDWYMLRDDFNRGVDLLAHLGLVYDILVFERHLPQTIEFVDRHPKQVFVLDHMAKPRIREHALSPWRENIRRLAERPNVYCKISGMVTEADYSRWTKQDLQPYLDNVLEVFGPDRLMFGSDWPVCLVAATYRQWFELVKEQIATLTQSEQEAILGGTAFRAYNLEAWDG